MTNAPYNPAGGTTYNLGTSIGSTDTTIILSSFLEPVTGTPYTMTLLNTQIVYATIAPKTTSSEFISFTGITQNANGTATLTGVTRGLAKKYPFTSSSSYKLPHSGQTQFIMSDAPQVFQEYVSLNNDETVTGLKTFTIFPQKSGITTPTIAAELATKAYVDLVAGGTTITNQVLIAGTAGEAVTAGQIVYFKLSDQLWYKADSSDTTKSVAVKLGVTQTTGSGSINVLTLGQDLNQTGLVAGTVYYLSTSGNVSSTIGTNQRLIGRAISTTSIMFEDDEQSRLVSLTDGSRTYVTDTGVADAYAITLIPAILSYKAGQVFSFLSSHTNTTTSTLNVNGLGAKTINKKDGATALVAGDIVSGQLVEVEYDGTNFQMLNPVANTVSLTAGAYPAGSGASITAVSQKISTIPTGVAVASSTALTALWTMTLAGGVLSTSNAVRVRTYVSAFQVDASKTVALTLTYGTTAIATTTVTATGNPGTGTGWIDVVLMGTGATGTQLGTLEFNYFKNDFFATTTPGDYGSRSYEPGWYVRVRTF